MRSLIGLVALAPVLLFAASALAGDAGGEERQVWEELRPAMLAFGEGGARTAFLSTCRRLLAGHPQTSYTAELTSLVRAMEREEAAGPPPFLKVKAEERTADQAIAALVYQLRDERSNQPRLGERTPVAELVARGPAALDALVAALDDDTPTRIITWQRDFYPVYFVLRRQDVAMKLVERIVGCRFYEEGATYRHLYFDAPERRRSAIDNVRAWWRKARGKPQAEMVRLQLSLHGQNLTLRDYDRLMGLETLAALEDPEAVVSELRRMLATDQYGLNSPVVDLLERIDPQAPVRAAFERFRLNASRDGDYTQLFRYGKQATYAEITRRLEATDQLDPGPWTWSDQLRWAADNGKGWALPILGWALRRTELTGSRGTSGGGSQDYSTADVAAELLQKLAEHDFGYRPDDGLPQRQAAIARGRSWWEGQGRTALAKVIAADHPAVIDPGDLLLSDEQLAAVAASIASPATRPQALVALSLTRSFVVQRALLIALAQAPEGEQRRTIMALASRAPALWHLPALTRAMTSDADQEVRLAAARAIAWLMADKNRPIWWVRLETREQALDAARRLASDPSTPRALRGQALEVLRAWGSYQDQPVPSP